MKERVLSIVLAVCMIMTMVPTIAFPVAAASATVYVSSSGNDYNSGTYYSPYATLSQAYSMVTDGGTIYVMSDLTVSTKLTFSINKTVTISTTNVGATGSAYTGNTVTVKRSSTTLVEPFTITAGTVTFTKITLDGNTTGVENGKPAPWLDYTGANFMRIDGTGKVVLDSGATIQNISAQNYNNGTGLGGILVKSQLYIKAGSKITNIAAAYGAIRVHPESDTSSGAYAEMSGGIIEYCDSFGTLYREGSTIYIAQAGTKQANFKMTGGSIENCGLRSYDRCHGTVYLHPNNTPISSFIMTGGTVKNNKSATVGGIYISSGNVQMSGDAQVFDNVDASGNKTNVLLRTGQTISLTGTLSDKANIGISTENMPTTGQADVTLGVSGSGYTIQAADARAFSSDKATTAGILLKNNQIVMSAEAKATDFKVSGKVSDYAGGTNALSGITVLLYDAADTTFARPLASAVTDASGNYSIPATVKAGSYVTHIAEKSNAYAAASANVTITTADVSNVNLTLVKSIKASVVLNKPIFNNDKSGYTFKSATIKNFTGVKSITFSITKGTTVKYIPAFLTPTSKLESIDGDTRTFTYVFEKGINVSQAEEFIRGIIFNYVEGAEISITVDNNVTKLPDGAKITEFAHSDGKNHYYMYVSSPLAWSDAYNAAKTYRYMGMVGYLATITSQQEDETLTNISNVGAWTSGTRLLKSAGTNIQDENSYLLYKTTRANYFYWAAGPEKGTVYYNNTAPTSTPFQGNTGYNGAYNNWQSGEPNDYQPGCEECMQVNYVYIGDAKAWNDLNASDILGYFVEFSDYTGGMDATYTASQTAVGTYNLATDGGVEEVATVTLNAPIYSSGNKSVFSFNNADITNISTVYSLTIKLDNYTNVLSKPATPVPSNELSNIAGSTNTITYQFKDGITQAEAQSFLRDLRFRYGGLRISSTTNVSITVDGNKTNLPQGASITGFNGHYYMYVPSNLISWTDAYNLAKSYTYMGLKGYLATITSQEEDAILTNISTISAWSAGTRYVNADGTKLADPTSVTSFSRDTNYYYWACGPEAGTIYYNSISPTPTPGAGYTGYNGAYNNWGADPRQPDAYNGLEVCMQVNWPFDTGANGIMRWNDLPNEGLPNISLVKGYFVEFSDYDGGRIDGFIQSASGKSTVPITVEKGDVFNSVKSGETYYVDTVLTAFDRNITKITVNSITVSNSYVLTGNKDTTYTIVATDLEGNTASMTVTMKTIAGISDPIKGLTVSNVQMGHKDSILAVKAALKAIDLTTASAAQKNEIGAAIQNCNNLYFALFNATATVANGANGWYKNGIGDIALTAPNGFTVSTNPAGTWTNSITVDKAEGNNKTAVYYLKETTTGEISGAKTFSYKIDTVAPTGSITIKTNSFTQFLNTITFGFFFKNTVDVTISGTDAGSAPVTVAYQKVSIDENYDENGTWINGSSFSVTANDMFAVYAKITDNAGNTSIMNTQGVVVYTDSTQNTSDISFTRTSTADITAKVNLNGNTVKEIKNGGTVIDAANYSVADDGTVTFKASYLDTLAVGTYTLTVSYNPLGENYMPGTSVGDAPTTTSIRLAVKAKELSGIDDNPVTTVTITPDRYVYTGNAYAPTVTVKDGTKTLTATVDYIINWTSDMTTAGVKTATITFIGIYSGTVTKSVTISNAFITDTTSNTQSVTYTGSEITISAPTAATVNAQPITAKYSLDGTTYNATSAPKFIGAGTYTVYYQLSAPNHDNLLGYFVFTVKAATDNCITGLALSNWTYGDAAKAPSAAATYGAPVFTYSNSENGTYTSTVPTQAGTYFVKASVAATANYNASEAKISFTISDKQIQSKDIAISGVDDSYLFTGNGITPEPTVIVNGTVLLKNTDYTVSYQNNSSIGTDAKVIVNLKGNYSGSAEKAFEIRYGTASEDELKDMITLPDYNVNGWHKEDIVISAKGDFTLSTTPTGSFGNTLTISEESTKTGSDYTFYIKALSGSVYVRTLNYKLDKTAPEGSIFIGNSAIKSLLNGISFGLLFNKDVDVTAASNDALSGVAKVEVYKTDAEQTVEQLASVTWSDYTAALTETAKDGEKFIYYARITDNAGNMVMVNSDGVMFDLTAPVISGVTNGEVYYTTKPITITDANLDSITVNGKKFVSGSILPGNQNATYEIVATDKSGNTTTVTVIMKPIQNISDNLGDIKEDDVKPENKNDIEDIKRKAEAVDIKNATAEEKQAIQDIIDRCNRLLKTIADAEDASEIPQTGENNAMILWISLMLISSGAVLTLGLKRRKKPAK